MEAGQVVAGNSGVDVMLGVVVHVPVEELEDWVQSECSTANAKVRVLVRQADVLRGVTHELDTCTEKSSKA